MDSLTNLATTEGRNPASEELDQLPTLDVLRLMNDEDHRVPDAIASQLSAIAAVVEAAVKGLSAGGRLILCRCRNEWASRGPRCGGMPTDV